MRVSNVTVRQRLTMVLLIGIFIFFIIDMRLGYVQMILGEGLTEKAKDLWSRNIPFEPNRGEIVDRNGVALATNISAPTVYVVPRQIKNPAEAAEKLASVLNMSKEKAYDLITKKTSSVKIQKDEKFPTKKQKKFERLGLKVYTLVKIPNGIIPLETIFPMFLDLLASIIKD